MPSHTDIPPRPTVSGRIETALGRWAMSAFRKPGRAIAGLLALTLLALFGARTLRLDPDLVGLLPETFDSVKDLRALEERAGAIGYVVVVAEGEDSAVLRRFATDLAPRVEALESIRYVDVKRPVDWFEDRGLYFLDLEDLQTVYDRLKTRARWEKRKHNPMYLDLEASEPPAVEFDDITEKYTGRGDQNWLARQAGSAWYEDPHRKMLVLLARPSRRSTDMDFAKQVVGEVQGAVDTMDLAAYGPKLTVQLTGRYKKKIEQKRQIQSDLGVASGLAMALSLLYLLVHFRRLSAVALVALPLILGLMWTFGLAGVIFGTLNLLTGFIGAILLGLGVDHGIHLLSRYQAERLAGVSPEGAVERAFGQTGRAVIVAALTTTVAFAGVAISEFRAFREFGIIAALGMICVVAAYSVALPALLGLGLGKNISAGAHRDAPWARAMGSRPLPLFLGALLVGAVGLSQLPKLEFDYDFAALEDGQLPAFRLDREVNRILGYSQTPVLVLTDRPEQEGQAADALRKVKADAGADSTIDMVATLADLVPDRQAEKKQVIDRIAKVVRRVKSKWLDDDLKDARKQVLRMAKQPPFTRAQLPDAVLRQFQGPTARPGEGFVLVFPRIALSDGAKVPAFAAEARRAAELPEGRLPVAGEAMILADILEMVSREGAPVLGMTLGLVLLTLWLVLGGLRGALVGVLAAGATLGGTLAMAGAVGIRLNYLNIIMIPVLFGIAVDGAVHLLTRLDSEDASAAALTETGRAIAGALLTTALGFGALTLADHPGLNSLGALAVLGLAVNALVCLVGVPAGLLTFKKLSERRKV